MLQVRSGQEEYGDAGSWRNDGIWFYHGATVTCFPPAAVDPEVETVKRLIAVDPRIRPLWMTKCWERPEGSRDTRSFTALGWELDDPKSALVPATGLLLPVTPNPYGIRYRAPIVVRFIFDGLEDIARKGGIPEHNVMEFASRARQNGVVGDYVPFSSVLPEVRLRAWEMSHEREYAKDDGSWERDQMKRWDEADAAEKAARRKENDDRRHQKAIEERISAQYGGGGGSRTFVDSRKRMEVPS